MIEKTFPNYDKTHNYSSISNKLFDVTTISPVLTLSYFSSLEIDPFCFGNHCHQLLFAVTWCVIFCNILRL